jgi:major vault protein
LNKTLFFNILFQPVTPLKVVPANSALRLKAVLDFDDETAKEQRRAGDEWLFEGPATYIPRKEVSVEEQIRATVIGSNQAIRLCAKKEITDRNDQRRVTGEEWLVKKTGAYLPLAYVSEDGFCSDFFLLINFFRKLSFR